MRITGPASANYPSIIGVQAPRHLAPGDSNGSFRPQVFGAKVVVESGAYGGSLMASAHDSRTLDHSLSEYL
jgi:hypothetical protein